MTALDAFRRPFDPVAAIPSADGNDLENVDLRTVETDRLRELRTAAGAAGDLAMVETIDRVVGARGGDAYRLSYANEQRIRDAVVRFVGTCPAGPLTAAAITTAERVAASSIGCSVHDLRDVELAHVAAEIRYAEAVR